MRVIRDITLHVNMTPLTVEDQLLIKIAQLEKPGLVKKLSAKLSFQRDSEIGIRCLISYE